MIASKRFMILVLSMFMLAGCATQQDIYYWGEYEQLIYDTYVEPGKADPQTQIEKLTADIQKSESLGKRVAPGIYAHLGYMYAVQGKDSQSKAAFLEEKNLYPESIVFIDGMLMRAEKSEGKL